MLKVEGVRIEGWAGPGGRHVDLSVGAGEAVAVLGPRGAGGSALLDAVCGLRRPVGGRIRLADRDIDRLPAHRIAALGVARTFEVPALCTGLSVLDNLALGCAPDVGPGVLASVLPWSRNDGGQARRRRLERLLDLFELAHLRQTPVGALSPGLRRRVEVARALAGDPRVVLLDEPLREATPQEEEALARQLRSVRRHLGVAVLVACEQAHHARDLADRVVALDGSTPAPAPEPKRPMRDPLRRPPTGGTAGPAPTAYGIAVA